MIFFFFDYFFKFLNLAKNFPKTPRGFYLTPGSPGLWGFRENEPTSLIKRTIFLSLPHQDLQ